MTEKEIKRLLQDYLKGTISAHDEKRLEEFDAKLMSHGQDLPHGNNAKVQARKALLQTLSSRQRKRVIRLGFRMAASIALVLGMGYALVQFNKTEAPVTVNVLERSTEWGQKSTLELPDGTMVKLNSGSMIRFPETFSEDFREVELFGEAFFDVTENPDKPFLIKSDGLQTTVLGTSFNVNAYTDTDEIAVTVLTGKVKIASNETEILLHPNEQGTYNRVSNQMSKEVTDIEKYIDWKDGIIHFDGATMEEIALILERWYGVNVLFGNESIKQCNLTATYQNELLTAVLESIVFTKKGLSYEYTEDQEILITGKCNIN